MELLKDCDFNFIEDVVFGVHRKMETVVLSPKLIVITAHKAIIGILLFSIYLVHMHIQTFCDIRADGENIAH